MQVVIPITAQIEHEELRFTLRSLEKFLDPFEVTIVCNIIPDWLTGVTQLCIPDLPGRKHLNIKRKIMAALHLYEEIFYLADDVFLLKHCVAKEFPYFYDGLLGKRNIEAGAGPLKKQLQEKKKGILNFDIHYPVIYRKDFLQVAPLYCEECLVKSAYLNHIGVKPIKARDAKIVPPMMISQIEKFVEPMIAFSSGKKSWKSIRLYLEMIFPNKSRFELYE